MEGILYYFSAYDNVEKTRCLRVKSFTVTLFPSFCFSVKLDFHQNSYRWFFQNFINSFEFWSKQYKVTNILREYIHVPWLAVSTMPSTNALNYYQHHYYNNPITSAKFSHQYRQNNHPYQKGNFQY